MNIKEIIGNSILVKQAILADENFIRRIDASVNMIVETYKNKGVVLFCGNGGSAADAQHWAAEFTGRFYYDRPPLNADALHVDTSYLTAVANDYSFDEVYARMVRAKGKAGDVLVGISTSGNSANVINAMKAAKEIGMKVIAFTGETGGEMKDVCDVLINVPSTDTPRIQESHGMIGHIICQGVEEQMFPKL